MLGISLPNPVWAILTIVLAYVIIRIVYHIGGHLGFGQRISLRLRSKYSGSYSYFGGNRSILDGGASHRFFHQLVSVFNRPVYCNVCEGLMAGVTDEALCCEACGYCSHVGCVGRAVSNCKRISIEPKRRRGDASRGAGPSNDSDSESERERKDDEDELFMDHHWARGNHSTVHDICAVCGLVCGSLFALSGLHCTWCQVKVHERCVGEVPSRCDLGPRKKLIVPPTRVIPMDDEGRVAWHLIDEPTGEKTRMRRVFSRGMRVAQSTLRKGRETFQKGEAVLKRLRRKTRTDTVETNESQQPRFADTDLVSSSVSSGLSSSASSSSSTSSSPALDAVSSSTSSTPEISPVASPAIRSSRTASPLLSSGVALPPSVLSPSPYASATFAPLSTSASSAPGTSSAVAVPKTKVTWKITVPFATSPLLVFINRKSGGNVGAQLMHELMSLLNPIQVFDLTEGGPMPGLKLFENVPRVRILVCGGDGTAAWVLSAVDSLRSSYEPPVAVLPVGTGNDLARSLGWGGGYDGENVSDILYEVEHAHPMLLDRWDITVTPESKRTSDQKGPERKVMNNYLGIGMDAYIAKRFHTLREQFPEKFQSQLRNKMWYGQLGAEAYFFPSNPDCLKGVILECDGEVLDLTGLEGVLIINIKNYGGGADLWGTAPPEGKQVVPSTQDRLLEVCGIRSSLHMGQINIGINTAIRLGQGHEITVRSAPGQPLPLEIDGEPWEQTEPSVLRITHRNQALMLSPSRHSAHTVLDQIGGVLDWAEATRVISAEQRLTLLKEMASKVNPSQIAITSTES